MALLHLHNFHLYHNDVFDKDNYQSYKSDFMMKIFFTNGRKQLLMGKTLKNLLVLLGKFRIELEPVVNIFEDIIIHKI